MYVHVHVCTIMYFDCIAFGAVLVYFEAVLVYFEAVLVCCDVDRRQRQEDDGRHAEEQVRRRHAALVQPPRHRGLGQGSGEGE